MITCMTDEPQSATSQRIFPVTEEITPESEVKPESQVGQGADLSPDLPPPGGFGEEVLPPEEGGGPGKLIILVVILVLFIGGIFFLFRSWQNKKASSGPITLTYWGLWEDESIWQPLIEEYQKNNPQVTIKYVMQTPKQYRERLQAAIERGEVDLFRFHNTWVPMLKNQLAALPESVMSKKEFETIFYPVVKTDLKVGQNYVGIPLMFDGLALFYNEDILKAAGKSVPKTWDELQETALALTVKDVNGSIKTAGIALGTANNVEHFSDILALMFLQNEADLKSLKGPEATEALAYYRMFAEKPNNTWDEAQPNSIVAFASGKVAMIFAPSWQAFNILNLNKELKFKTAPVPQLPGVNITWASYWVEGVASNSKHQKEAWDFLKFVSSRENLTKLYSQEAQLRAFGEIYSRTDLAESLTSHPIVGAFVLQAPQAKSFPLASRTFDNGLNDRLIKYLEDAVNSLVSGASPESALQTAGAGFNQVLSQYGLVSTTGSSAP